MPGAGRPGGRSQMALALGLLPLHAQLCLCSPRRLSRTDAVLVLRLLPPAVHTMPPPPSALACLPAALPACQRTGSHIAHPCAGARVLVVETEAVQQELLALQAQLPSAAYSSVLDQLGVVFEWLGGTGAARPDWGLVQATAARWERCLDGLDAGLCAKAGRRQCCAASWGHAPGVALATLPFICGHPACARVSTVPAAALAVPLQAALLVRQQRPGGHVRGAAARAGARRARWAGGRAAARRRRGLPGRALAAASRRAVQECANGGGACWWELHYVLGNGAALGQKLLCVVGHCANGNRACSHART